MRRALSASWDRSPQRCPASRHALLTACCYVWRPGFDLPSKSLDSHGYWDSFKDQGRTYLLELGVLVLLSLPQALQSPDADVDPALGLDLLLLSVEPESVLVERA